MGGFYGMIDETINKYTGLSPISLVVISILMIITYKIVSGMFVMVDDYKAVQKMKETFEEDLKREPVQLGEITEEKLKEFDGSDPKKPLLMAIKGQIYDVSKGRMFYGPGGPYALFAGRDATRALALMSFDPQDLNGNIEGLSESELDVLQDWELKFIEKYPKVGVLKNDGDAMVKEDQEEDDKNVLESKKAV
ncbi:membrane steroid-binding protein 2-like [Amaranthus tricolor]|uniref:membrane steroid-binding protein 2-like n=1 Tax=Amaranthus tricolor TaxID=29722 RepID=UPI00258FDFFE|nr:membrane steroid-binding protein 2-like [Amaranthus tricolor]